MPAPIFLSYRRSDTAGHAGRLHDHLLHWWDDSQVFYDLHSIEAGEAFPQRLEQAVDAARLMLVVIGPAWETEFAERERRGEVDWVRREVARALARLADGQAVTVLPVLMSRSTPPAAADLPAELQALAPVLQGRQPRRDNALSITATAARSTSRSATSSVCRRPASSPW